MGRARRCARAVALEWTHPLARGGARGAMRPAESGFNRVHSWLIVFLLSVSFCGCSLAPKYSRPTVPMPAAFKENSTNLWQVAQPNDAVTRTNWWTAFHDAQLNSLEAQVAVSNQNVAAAFANVMSARAIVREAEAQLFPTLVANPSLTRQRTSANTSVGGLQSASLTSASRTFNSFDLLGGASWQPDLWGRVRNTIKANSAQAQASAADLESTRLTAQAELAADYFQLRAQETLIQLFDDTVKAYQQSYNLEQVLFKTGIASDQDVAQAETQLKTAQAQETNLGILRAQLEHAIAVLLGRPPSSFSIARQPAEIAPPEIPSGLPSQLLERRPDIAASERLVAAANAQIGVAKAAYFPNLTLSASGGFESTTLGSLVDWPSRVWSIGASASETILDFGARAATVAQSRAAYDAAVAQYRQTVLTAFQQVEDNLASLRILREQIQQQDAAVQASERYLHLAQDRYRLGIDSYLNVITAQATLLANRQTAVNLRGQELTAAVQLIENLGGGWNVAEFSSR